jgi:hypothetical protein
MLWIYVENDSFIGPALARRMFKEFTKAGGIAKLSMLPAYADEGHFLFTDDGRPIWGPVIDDWLSRVTAEAK